MVRHRLARGSHPETDDQYPQAMELRSMRQANRGSGVHVGSEESAHVQVRCTVEPTRTAPSQTGASPGGRSERVLAFVKASFCYRPRQRR